MMFDLRVTMRCPLCGETTKVCVPVRARSRYLNEKRVAEVLEHVDLHYPRICDNQHCGGGEMYAVAVD